MATKKPNLLRFAVPLAIGYMPMAAALFWLRLMDVVHEMAKLPPITISSEISLLIAVVGIIGTLAAVYRLWADFARGDYFIDLAIWQDARR